MTLKFSMGLIRCNWVTFSEYLSTSLLSDFRSGNKNKMIVGTEFWNLICPMNDIARVMADSGGKLLGSRVIETQEI